ncbi:MAG: hypothetical protein U0573_05555 [Phycisphaerales bacterium]|nr:hypothetical protein [Planctomycetota bacterium]
MPARKAKHENRVSIDAKADAKHAAILVVHPVKARRDQLLKELRSAGRACVAFASASSALESVAADSICGVLIAADAASDVDHLRALPGRKILLCDKVDMQAARLALSLRVDDLADANSGAARIADLFDLSAGTEREPATRREKRLLGLCRRLNDSRKELSRELTRLCSDMTRSYAELAGRIDTVAIAGEFTGLVRQELELEGLMRTSLEFLLAKLGSMNAALFLPSSSGDWSLGAYVNYDRARDSAEMMLDHLADTAPHRIAQAGFCMKLDTPEEVAQALPGAAEWLGECAVLGSPAEHEGETLACLLFFRDRETPFPEHAKETMEAIARILASQLARVIKVHHRHLPKEQWASPGDPLPPAGGDGFDDADDRDLLC